MEDNENDALLTKAAFRKVNSQAQLAVVADGQEAWDYLRRRGAFVSSKRPDLVVLDMDLPKVNGYQLLEIVDADDDLRDIPVVILSGHVVIESILGKLRCQVVGILSKPFDANGYIQTAMRDRATKVITARQNVLGAARQRFQFLEHR